MHFVTYGSTYPHKFNTVMRGSKGGSQGVRAPGKPQVVIGFFSIAGTDPVEKRLDPTDPNACRGRSVQPSVKFNDD